MAGWNKLDKETRLIALRIGVAGVVALGMLLLMHVFGKDRCSAAGGQVVGWLSCELDAKTVRFEALFTTEEKVFSAAGLALAGGLAGIWLWHTYLKPDAGKKAG
jgi:hypothetical protein